MVFIRSLTHSPLLVLIRLSIEIEMLHVLLNDMSDFVQVPESDSQLIGVLIEFFDGSFYFKNILGEINDDGFVPWSFSIRIIIPVFFPP